MAGVPAERPNGGLAVLSSYPMEVQASDPWVPVIVTRVDVDGTPVAFIAAHAINPLRSSRRDAQLTAMRGLIDEQAAAGLPVVLAGDLNTNAFEPSFWPLSSGLTDVDARGHLGSRPQRPGDPAHRPHPDHARPGARRCRGGLRCVGIRPLPAGGGHRARILTASGAGGWHHGGCVAPRATDLVPPAAAADRRLPYDAASPHLGG
ncbi:MAG: hypothetical protein U0667_13710 [Chloroflexota bacterium]